MQTINIDLLAGIAGKAIIGGVEHNVLDLTAEEYAVTTQPVELMARAAEIIQRIVPTFDREKIPRLTMRQQGAIIAIGTGVIDAVEQFFPNADGPAATEAAPA